MIYNFRLFFKVKPCFVGRFVHSEPRKNTTILKVAIIGRPNVGKSTLFNRLTGRNAAIVSPVAGTTRDRKEGKGNISGLCFDLVDTGGLDNRGSVSVEIKKQVELALKTSHVALFVIDAKVGVTPVDTQYIQWLRKIYLDSHNKLDLKDGDTSPKDVIVIANKTEGGSFYQANSRVMDTIAEAFRWGLGDPIPISATHGDGMSDLFQSLYGIAKRRGLDCGDIDPKVAADAKKMDAISVEERVIQLAIMGKPNVGKSSLLNAICKEERVIAGPTAGLTRDAISVEWQYNDRQFRLVDTAGLTRITPHKQRLTADDKKHVTKIESMLKDTVVLPGIAKMNPEDDPSQFSCQVSEASLVSALNALRFSQVVCLVIEGDQGKFSKIDLQLTEKCHKEGRALVIVANKSDIVAEKGVTALDYAKGVRKHCEHYLKDFGHIPIVTTCAIRRHGINKLLETVIKTHDAWSARINTWVLNRWLADLLVISNPPRVSGKAVKIKYITQIKSRPPAFALFCNVDKIPEFFEKFIRFKLQTEFKLEGVFVRLVVRKTETRKENLQRKGVNDRSKNNTTSNEYIAEEGDDIVDDESVIASVHHVPAHEGYEDEIAGDDSVVETTYTEVYNEESTEESK